ncbi:MAG: SHOCT domain-containing protein [Phycisphaerae bacterium]|nr:SHOCT domain-containing protein [Phycisphaerae bacterium]
MSVAVSLAGNLASTTPIAAAAGDLLWRSVVFSGLLVGLIVLMLAARYYHRLIDEPPETSEPWTLADLRRLRADGELTEEEYDRLRAAMIAGIRSGLEGDNAAAKGAEPPDSSHKE